MKILRTHQVMKVTGLSRSTLWRLERRGDFPPRLRLSWNSCGWLDSEIQDWLRSRPRGMTGAERDAATHSGAEAA